ncbi:MAG: hypothetical protein AB1555_15710 [Nitrospirota bacterium]
MRGQMHGGHDQGEPEEHSADYLTHLQKHAKEIGLTPEQIGKVKAMQLDLNRSRARKEADIKIATLELHALLEEEEEEQADLSAVQAKVDQLEKAEGALLLAAIKAERDAMAMLTPEQREKDRAHRERMMREGRGEGQHRGGMGGMQRGMGTMGCSGARGDHGGDGPETERPGGEEHKH